MRHGDLWLSILQCLTATIHIKATTDINRQHSINQTSNHKIKYYIRKSAELFSEFIK